MNALNAMNLTAAEVLARQDEGNSKLADHLATILAPVHALMVKSLFRAYLRVMVPARGVRLQSRRLSRVALKAGLRVKLQ